MYSEPLQDSQHVTPVIDMLLTAAEHLEVKRKEGERERQGLELTYSPMLTQAQDEVRVSHYYVILPYMVIVYTIYVVDKA